MVSNTDSDHIFENGTTTFRSNLQWTFFGRYRNLANAAGGGFHLCIHVMAVSNAVIPSLVDHQRTGVETTAKLSPSITLWILTIQPQILSLVVILFYIVLFVLILLILCCKCLAESKAGCSLGGSSQ